MAMKLQCYCCAAPIKDKFVLVAYARDGVDRVFLFKPSCVHKVDEQAQTVSVSKDAIQWRK